MEPPDLKLAVVANRSDHLTAQVVAGEPPLPDGWIYVRTLGLFEIIRAERWPVLAAGVADRLLLVLRESPMR